MVNRPQTTTTRRRLLRDARRFLRGAYADPDLTLADLAEAIGTSPRHLQRVFLDEAGESFRSCLLRIRMERARVLLTRSGRSLSVEKVARRVGYRQASGLRQAFMRYYGQNPSEVRPPTPEYLGTWVADETKPD